MSGSELSGKSVLANKLREQHDCKVISTKEVLENLRSVDRDRQIRKNSQTRKLPIAFYDFLSKLYLESHDNTVFLIDSIGSEIDLLKIREFYPNVLHISLTAREDTKQKRLGVGTNIKKDPPGNSSVDNVERLADIVIDTDQCTPDDVLTRAAANANLYGSNNVGFVDVIVGGQYGSEGKGQIAAYLSKNYDLLVRVGGPNAGHTVYEEPKPYTFKLLPAGTRKSQAKLLLGPGSVLSIETLLKEIAECEVDYKRLSIDPQAVIIEKDDEKKEMEDGGLRNRISSTGQGVGIATSRKIIDRGAKIRLAKDIEELKSFVRPAFDVLSNAFGENQRVLLEGTQGTMLSLHHGYYPHVTSRDTTVAGCLSEAGIPISKVRKIVMVCRTYPIRVGNDANWSGPLSGEINLQEISNRSGIALDELEKREVTSTTHRKRRIGEFDWTILRRSSFLNHPTDIALTFTDYLSVKNRDAMRFDQLTPETIRFVNEVERVSASKVSLIGTGFNSRSIIDRRSW